MKSQQLFQPVDSEHDAEKCERFSDDIMLSLYNVEQDSDFRPTRPKIILF
ncbi:hypothetical protein Rleg_1460 [Rhizobium leguminosarum bv. trifolii WSM1325]|jgi:hypothetical protein|uniref:Uncharacterized protein n=1 Tax=Rhizobium leguminosarum bv. trifolii (strain WSM1325) TaxID=395491 RepID=C6AV27_RHILS|nr:hypothetical protein Rleg_1460 [Rhizobium leguminosarum bv. trifolii WSM1325]